MIQFGGSEALNAARLILHSQGIIAVKGLGGYHLVCNARSTQALTRLRTGKNRPHKPLAVMFRDLEALQTELDAPAAAVGMLTSPIKPIVILRRRETSALPPVLAPGLDTIGAMLPYTTLHFALFDELLDALVVTSANSSGEPVIFQDDLAHSKLATLADGILTHNHTIMYPLDDSILYYVDTTGADEMGGRELTAPILIRRGRGYVPLPLPLARPLDHTILGCGGDLKASFCLGSGQLAYPSPPLGTLENPETLERYRFTLSYYRKAVNLDPTVIAYDLNPALISSQVIAMEDFRHLTQMPVQHHHAHVAACMGENGVHGPVLAIAYDGSGYGPDGKVWGGEIFSATTAAFQRLAHWQNVPLPGNDLAIRQPWRMALSYLRSSAMEESCRRFLDNLPGNLRQDATRLLGLWENVQPRWLQTSSMGRLFDGIAALLGLCLETSYTGQPAILLENAAWQGVKKMGLDGFRPYDVDKLAEGSHTSVARSSRPSDLSDTTRSLPTDHLPEAMPVTPLIQCIVKDQVNNIDMNKIAARFHRTVAEITAAKAGEFCRQFNLGTVALSGGVWQNQLLSYWTVMLLRQMGLEVLQHKQLSPSDECLGFGQVVVAGARLNVQKGGNLPCALPYRQE
ncbi:MAG: carbamoyltransferase HypF [Firmicutes bacterium]|nr:carbamoyltransferase HypF [Bacillota bacterium]